MPFTLFKSIGNGLVQELVTTLDPTKNYRFRMNATNRDGTSPWSNTVEWGAIRMDAGVYQVPIGMAFAKYPEDANWAAGVWTAQFHGDPTTIVIRRYPTDWSGDSSIVPTQELVLSHTYLSDSGVPTITADHALTFYQVKTPAPGSADYLVMKIYDGAGAAKLFIIIPGAVITARQVPSTNFDIQYDAIMMEDGVLLAQFPVSESVVWRAVTPTAATSPATITYADTGIISFPDQAGTYVQPYLMNRYPLVLGTAYTPLSWLYPYKISTWVAAQPWQMSQIGWTPVLRETVLALSQSDMWRPLTVRAMIGSDGMSAYLVSDSITPSLTGWVLGFSSLDSPDSPPLYVVTDTYRWGGMFVMGNELYVWGRSNDTTILAPGTPNLPLGVVNIHQMRLDQNSIIPSEVGANLMTFTAEPRPAAVSTIPVTNVLAIGQTEPGNFNGNVVVLNDRSILIYSMYVPPTELSLLVSNYTAPVFVIHPESQTIDEGNPVTFTASANVSGSHNTVSYQWTVDGSPFSGGTQSVVSGVATLVLTATPIYAGSVFRCVATDAFGSQSTSLRAILGVVSLP